MTGRVLTPWWRKRTPDERHGEAAGSTLSTRILDWGHPRVRRLAQAALAAANDGGDVATLRAAHRLIADRVRPVYSVEDTRRVSSVLARGSGSCSQRLAVLEAVARSSGIATRVRGLVVDGRFWYPRFPRMRVVVPDAVLLAWPQFRVEERWVDSSELFGTLAALAAGSQPGFTNDGGETLFDALPRTALDWDGRTSQLGTCSACDLSARVVVDLGLYESRDQLFRQQGQTLSWLARVLVEPVLGRWSP